MNTGTVSATLGSPTFVTLGLTWAIANITNNAGSTGTIVFGVGATTLSASTDSTIPPGVSVPIKNPSGIGVIAFGSTGGDATADIQLVAKRA